MITEAERFDTQRADLCHCLRWKSMFYQAERDPSVQPGNDGLFWCVFTQSCMGPDGELAEPGSCSSPGRQCYDKGYV